MRFTSDDLAELPDDAKRYEIIDGDLHISDVSHWYHKLICARACSTLGIWSSQSGYGVANLAPGLIFGDDDDVAPDVIWISNERLATALGPDSRLHSAPELVIEALSPGSANQHRDREAKSKLSLSPGRQRILDYRLAF
ncbi:MAG: Uma2 family endonuclease [Blastocatellia bacterium]